MATVKQLIEQKDNREIYILAGTATVLRALEVMAEANIGSVMVVEKERIVGIFTERDYTRKCEVKGLAAADTLVREAMTGQMITVKLDTSAEQCMALMNKYHVRHLPVIEDDTFVGMVSIRDVANALLSDRESTIKGLENYILGSDFAT